MIYQSVQEWSITRMATAWTPDPKNKLLHKFTYYYTFMPIYGSKLQILGRGVNILTSQKLALNGPVKGQLVTYSKIQNRTCIAGGGHKAGTITTQGRSACFKQQAEAPTGC